MSDLGTAPSTGDARPADPPPGQGRGEAIAHLVGGLGIGAVSGFLILWTSPGLRLGVPVDGFDIVNVAPGLVALAALGLALVAPLRPYAWLLAAAGLAGFAGLYAQGDRLDGRTLMIALIVVIALQFGGLLLAFGGASARARSAIAIGLGAGLVAGLDVLAALADAVGSWAGASTDAVVFGGLAVLVAGAGVILLRLDRRVRPVAPAPSSAPAAPVWSRRSIWTLVAVAIASGLATGLTEVWDAVFEQMTMSYLGGISEADAQALATADHLARVALAVLVVAVLSVAALLWGAPGAARWVATGLGAGLLLAVLQGFVIYRAAPVLPVLAGVGALTGALLARRAARVEPWEAVGLALGAVLALVSPAGWLWPVGWFGFGIAVAAGASGLGRTAQATAPDAGSPGRPEPTAEEVGLAAGLGVAALLLSYQVVVPASITGTRDGGLSVVAAGVILAAAAAVAFSTLTRRRPRSVPGAGSVSGRTPS